MDSDQMNKNGNMNILMEVKVEVTGKLGTCDMTMREVMELAPGTVVQLKQRVQDPVLLCLNDRVVAKGEVVVVEDSFGVKITEMMETT